MQMSGDQVIQAPRHVVWDALNDPDILKQCIPGCESVERTSPTSFTAKVVAKVGPVKASFTGAVTLSDLDPPNGYRISGEGQGGVAGFAKGGASVQLSDAEAGGTRLAYQVDAQIGGKLAQLGARLIDATAKSYAKEFFEKFGALVATPAVPEAPAADHAAQSDHGQDHGHASGHGHDHHHEPAVYDSGNGLPPGLWMGGLALGATLLVWLALVFG
ncbi:MAG: carbon monoxide dehydrogenase [Alphaproteobacteria bacterium]|nr:SRPBCC domain-containing protein [Alphaproteobacteria bacterium]TAD90719.1 MAG: carbon monoxide dehydrogenase [Alphaproteobacteria bacterium]